LSVQRSAFGVRRRRSAFERLSVVVSNFQVFNTFKFYVIVSSAMDDFTQFDASERCREFARGVGKHLNRGAFSKDPVLTTALRKTLLSVYSNFGEGFERDGNREFAQFLSIAKGSIGETRSQLIYALDFGYLKPETFSELNDLAQTATACLGGLIRYLNNSSFRGRKFRRPESSYNESKPLKSPNTAPAES
jgi:four helix bundle protein